MGRCAPLKGVRRLCLVKGVGEIETRPDDGLTATSAHEDFGDDGGRRGKVEARPI